MTSPDQAARPLGPPSSRISTPTIHTTTLITFLAASSAPSPLYRLYQAAWGFSPLVLTTIFAAYALALLAALLTFGSLSDHLGRKPVILAALALEIGAMILFITASDAAWLIAARLLQGLATGIATASLGAALLDIDRDRGALTNSIAPMIGMGVGALGSSLLLQYAPAPMHLVYVLLLAVLLVQSLLTWRVPETAPVTQRLGPGVFRALRPRVAVPARARAVLLAVTPISVAVWVLGGFYLSLMPSLIAKVGGAAPPLIGGLAVTALTVSGALAILLVRRRPPLTALLTGSGALILGLLAIMAGATLGSPAVLLAGSLVAGVGFGSGFLGAVRTLMPLAAPDERAGLLAAFYVECYLATALPAILAGYLAQQVGLLATANLYGAGIIALAAAALLLTLAGRRRTLTLQAQAARPSA